MQQTFQSPYVCFVFHVQEMIHVSAVMVSHMLRQMC